MASQFGLKETQRFSDIEWLMPSINLDHVEQILDLNITRKSGTEWTGFCPDHFLFTGREPSDPKWNLNTLTGQTFCFTEGRGSNLVFIGARLLKKSPTEVAAMFTGNADLSLETLSMTAVLKKAERLLSSEPEEQPQQHQTFRNFDDIASEIIKRPISQRTYDFFMNPPGKAYSTNIKPETVDRYKVFERMWGFYADRAIIPYFMRSKLVGFAALDILGKQKWLEKHPSQTEKDYRKVRYPEGWYLSECLFGFDNCEKKCDTLFILEGAREVMKLTQEGFSNAVAISGAYMSQTQYLCVAELNPREVVLMFDGDDAGVNITQRTEKILTQNFAKSSVVPCYLPRGRDPKTLDKAELDELVEEARTSRRRSTIFTP